MRSRVSSRGQITIPVRVQRELGLRPGMPVEFELQAGGVLLRKGRIAGDRAVDRAYGVLRGLGLPSTDRILEELRGPALKPLRRRAGAKAVGGTQ